MRLVLAAVVSLALAAPAVADDVPAGAQPAIDAVTALVRSSKNTKVRKIKLDAAGNVCAVVRATSSADDVEFTWTKASGEVWINESPQAQETNFVIGHPSLRRSDDRADFRAWKACQSAK